MPAIGVVLGLCVGLLAGGRVSNLVEIRLRWLPLLLLAACARFAIEALAAAPSAAIAAGMLSAYFGLAIALVRNRRLPGMGPAAVGIAFNGFAILMNGGRMPVWVPSALAAGLPIPGPESPSHIALAAPLDSAFLAHAGPLADLIPLPLLGGVASLGDFVLAAGLATFVFAALVREPSLFAATSPTNGRSIPLVKHPFIRLAANGGFSALWLGQTVSSLGDRLHQVALVFLVANLSPHPEVAVGLVFAASTVPIFLIGLPAGAIVDRSNHRHLLIATDLGRAAITLTIPAAATISVIAVIPLVFALASLSTFFRPARTALLPELVERDDLVAANSALWIGDTITDTAGYAVAGILVAYLHSALALAFWLDAASYVVSAMLIASIAGRTGGGSRRRPDSSLTKELAVGWQFLRQESALFATSIQAMVAQSSLGMITSLSPWLMAALATAAVSREEAYGYLEAAIGVGAVAGGLVIGSLGHRVRKGLAIGAAYAGLGFTTIALASSQWLAVALLAGVGIGLANVAFVVPSQTLFQLRTPPEMLGRVIAIRLALVNAVLAVAMISSGFLAEAFGVSAVLVACGLLTTAAGVAGFFVKAIREA